MSDTKDIVESEAAKVLPSRFKKGQSGNPAGRPKGSKNKITALKIALEGDMRVQIREHMADILAVAIDMAKKGDSSMIKLLVDKTMSSSKMTDDEEVGTPRVQIMIGRVPTEGVVVATPIEGEVIATTGSFKEV